MRATTSISLEAAISGSPKGVTPSATPLTGACCSSSSAEFRRGDRIRELHRLDVAPLLEQVPADLRHRLRDQQLLLVRRHFRPREQTIHRSELSSTGSQTSCLCCQCVPVVQYHPRSPALRSPEIVEGPATPTLRGSTSSPRCWSELPPELDVLGQQTLAQARTQQVAGDHVALHLVGALADPADAHLAVPALEAASPWSCHSRRGSAWTRSTTRPPASLATSLAMPASMR